MFKKLIIFSLVILSSKIVFAIAPSGDQADVQTTLSQPNLQQEDTQVAKKETELTQKKMDVTTKLEENAKQFDASQGMNAGINKVYNDVKNDLKDPKTVEYLKTFFSSGQQTPATQEELKATELEKTSPEQRTGIVQKLIELYELLTKKAEPASVPPSTQPITQ